ncbi:MAG: methylenetetrahydrofolate dehydrogenase [Gammaproteobacteria bacterium]|jgi:methylenetetrahydrofolate/methylenetetrahydromethanopterin dehydrogenase (NADP+)|nr:methylenetetrahydrofolate dehydrogenase [Gammaproteobacteria bacterium]
MKKLLLQLDTDANPSVFDTVVGYDGGADHVIGHGNCNPDNVGALVEGAIFTRSPKEKKNTALFLGGSDLIAGEKLLSAVKSTFFSNFRVSAMLDSNGSNTTAAAAVAKMMVSTSLKGKRAVILGGTGPVGQRAAVMLVQEGASVCIASRKQSRAVEACAHIETEFDVTVEAAGAATNEERAKLCADAQIVFTTGAAGVQLLDAEHWQNNKNIEVIADANATPPLGIGGTDMMDEGKESHGTIIWGAIGFGKLKLALHRACIAKLFESNDQIFDAGEIFALAKKMA